MADVSKNRTSVYLKKLASLFFLIGICMSFSLWKTDRYFPIVPLVDCLDFTQHYVNTCILSVFIFLLVVSIFSTQKKITYLLFSSLVLLLAIDQMRWQPWVYIYTLFLMPFLFKSSNQEKLLFYRTLLIGIYVWSGIHKLNPNFNNLIVESIAIDFFHIQNIQLIDLIKTIGFTIPLIEISLGLFLIFRKTRNFAVISICTMHLFILIYLSPLVMNGNYIVYPWNVFMSIAVTSLFYNNNDIIYLSPKKHLQSKKLSFLLLFVIGTPLLKPIGLWDTYTSFSFYSGNASNLYALSTKKHAILDSYKIIDTLVAKGSVIDIGAWSTDELKVPIPPEKRILNKIAEEIKTLDTVFIFLETDIPLWERKLLDKYSTKSTQNSKEWIKELKPIQFKDSVTLSILRKF